MRRQVRCTRAHWLAPWLCLLATACGGGGGSTAPAGDTTAPVVIGVTPPDGSAGVVAQTSIVVDFSEALDCTAAAADALRLVEGSTPIAGTTTCSGNKLTFTAATGLPTNATLTASVDASVRDLAGNGLTGVYGWSFGVRPWTTQFGSDATETASDAALDGSGNVFVAGSTNGSVDGVPTAGGFDALLVKFDRFGSKQWSRLLGSSAGDTAQAVATDRSDNIYVGGVINFDNLLPVGGARGFVAKYDGSGTKLWDRLLASGGNDHVRSIAIDGEGNVIAAGFTRGDLFAPNGGNGGPDLFVAKYDGDGTLLWGRQLGTDTTDNAAGVATDAAGNVYLTGYTFGSLDGNNSAGDADAFLVKYDRDGVKQWTKQFGSVEQDIATAIAVDGAGDLYVVGRTVGALDGAPNAGGLDAFVAKFDDAGGLLWTRQFGSAADDYAYGMAVDAEDDVVVVGFTLGALAGSTSLGGTDTFTAKFDGAGPLLWLRQSGTAADDHAYGVGVDALSNVFTAGYTAGALDGNASAGGVDMFVLKHQADGKRR